MSDLLYDFHQKLSKEYALAFQPEYFLTQCIKKDVYNPRRLELVAEICHEEEMHRFAQTIEAFDHVDWELQYDGHAEDISLVIASFEKSLIDGDYSNMIDELLTEKETVIRLLTWEIKLEDIDYWTFFSVDF